VLRPDDLWTCVVRLSDGMARSVLTGLPTSFTIADLADGMLDHLRPLFEASAWMDDPCDEWEGER